MSESFNVADASFLDSYSSLWAEHDANSLFRSPGYLRMIAELTGADLAFVVRARGGRLRPRNNNASGIDGPHVGP